MIDSIGFDLDGTLWDYAARYQEFFTDAVKDLPYVHKPTVEEIYAVTGLAAIDYVETLFPELVSAPLDLKMSVFHHAEKLGSATILKEGGRLYDGLEEMLKALSGKYSLFIASNCEPDYLDNFLTFYGFHSYFADWTCHDLTKGDRTKGENIRMLCRKNGYSHTVFVGDAQSDADAAREASVPFVWASYGYGNVPSAQYRIDKPLDLVSLIKKM